MVRKVRNDRKHSRASEAPTRRQTLDRDGAGINGGGTAAGGAAQYDFTKVFAHIHKQSTAFLADKLKELGVNPSQFPHLMSICDHPGLTQDQIADKTRTDKSTVAKMVKQLLAAGLVLRKENPDDKRSYHLFPTRKARDLYPAIAAEKRRWHDHLTSGLTPVETELLRLLLEKLRY